MDPVNPIAGNPEALSPSPISPNKPGNSSSRDQHWITILAMAIFVIFSLGVVVFLYYQNQQLKSLLASFQPQTTPTPEATASPTPAQETPSVSSPSANMKIVSPLKVTGKVPPGWMNEGVFPIKLVDASQKLIVQGQAKENVPGTWLSGNAVSFTATLTFKTSATSGFLILENDNPSGDPANLKTFEVPVNFSDNVACTLDAKLCPDGTYVSRTGPSCEFAPCP